MNEISAFTGKYAFLSNFFAAPIRYENQTWPTVEHAYQAAKTLVCNEKERVRRAATPGAAKKLGRRVSLRRDWDAVKIGIMQDLVRAKFDQHPELRNLLIETKDAQLVEGNTWNDTFWGVCNGRGRNELGQILMNLRLLYVEQRAGERESPAQTNLTGGASVNEVVIFTDGACSGNPGPGGWCAILTWNNKERILQGNDPHTTNNRMEIAACIEGLKALKQQPCKVVLYTDSQYVVGVMSLGWRRKANHDLLSELDSLCAKHEVSFEHVRGHSGHAMNERADKLAKAEVDKQREAFSGTQCVNSVQN